MPSLLLKNVKKIYGMSSEEDAQALSIWTQDGTIEEIAPYETIREGIEKRHFDNAEIIDCSHLIALPGFIDCHTHLLFYGSRENELYMRAEGRPYLEILHEGGGIYNTVNAVREASEEALIQNGLKFLDKALRFGITTLEIKSGYGLNYDTEKKMLKIINQLNALHPVDIIPTFLVHTVPENVDRRTYINQVAESFIPEFKAYSDWFDIFLEKGVFDIHESELLIQRAIDHSFHVGIHTNQINDIGGVKLAQELGVRHVDHLEILSDEDAEIIIANKDLYAVFLPTAEGFVFSQHTGQTQKLTNIPNRIVLSSDFNPGSSPVLSPYLVITYALLRYRISDPYLLIDAYTKNPADMLYLEDRGMLKKGTKADIVLLELDRFEQIPYWGTIDWIRCVIKNGEIISFS